MVRARKDRGASAYVVMRCHHGDLLSPFTAVNEMRQTHSIAYRRLDATLGIRRESSSGAHAAVYRGKPQHWIEPITSRRHL